MTMSVPFLNLKVQHQAIKAEILAAVSEVLDSAAFAGGPYVAKFEEEFAKYWSSGSLLMAGAYLAITSMTSALTRNQVISFILSVVICLFLILAGWPPVTEMVSRLTESQFVLETVAALSVMTHFESFRRGIIDTRDLVFYIGLIVFCLFTTAVIIRNRRAG